RASSILASQCGYAGPRCWRRSTGARGVGIALSVRRQSNCCLRDQALGGQSEAAHHRDGSRGCGEPLVQLLSSLPARDVAQNTTAGKRKRQNLSAKCSLVFEII